LKLRMRENLALLEKTDIGLFLISTS
jgi:hypothetical protein